METGLKIINDIIENEYYIPKYQRGYRWTETNILQLLGDIYENKLVDSMNFKQDDIDKINLDKTHLRAMRKKIANEDEETSVWISKVDHLYCIQPLVVNKRSDGKYTVIDGQQRLTTISIMLAALSFLKQEIVGDNNKNTVISIVYESRPRSAELINSLYKVKTLAELKGKYSENIDFDYIIWAFETALNYYRSCIDDFAKIFQEGCVNDYLQHLEFVILHCVQFIWYDASSGVESSNEQKVFANFNTGKLPLTNSELIKAIFMNPSFFGEDIAGVNKIKDRQINISESWDRMETLLNGQEFWAFVPHQNQYDFEINNKTDEKYKETRIDVIFDFLVHKEKLTEVNYSKNDYSTFIALEKWILEKLNGKQNKREIMDNCWDEIKKIFSSLYELYEDKENNGKLYNLIGVYIYIKNLRKSDDHYYVSLNADNALHNINSNNYLEIFNFLDDISKTSRDKRMNEVLKELKILIFNTNKTDVIKKTITSIKYNDQYDDKISLCLLLFNILKLNEADGAGNRFEFSVFAKNKWQREHIFATRNEDVPEDMLYRKIILNDIIKSSEDFDDIQVLKENPYIKYWYYIKYGQDISNSNQTEDDFKAVFRKEIKFLKNSSDIMLRYELLDKSKEIHDLTNITPFKRARLVDNIINYREINKFIFSEINIEKYVNQALVGNNSKTDLKDFKDALNNYIENRIGLDCKIQIENIFKNFTNECSPYNFLKTTNDNEEALINTLLKNILAAYKNKLRNILWFTSEDREIINNATNLKEEFLKRKKFRNDNKHNEFFQLSDEDTELYDNSNELEYPDEVIQEKYKNIINISDDNNLMFVLKAIKLNKEYMMKTIEDFFEKEGIYCKELSDNSMGNMSLLSGSVNSSISNASFYKKSELVFQKSKQGAFVPLETLMVFAGAYNTDPIMTKEWSPIYRLNYIKELISTLTKESGELSE